MRAIEKTVHAPAKINLFLSVKNRRADGYHELESFMQKLELADEISVRVEEGEDREIDVISVVVDGRISHRGTLQQGKTIESNQVQVQRAGGEGFAHNEVNPDEKENRMIQIWVTPEKSGEAAGYKSYSLQQGRVTRVYGGDENQEETFASQTTLDVGLVDANQTKPYPLMVSLLRMLHAETERWTDKTLQMAI